jgi:phosphatidylserine decarboxylase
MKIHREGYKSIFVSIIISAIIILLASLCPHKIILYSGIIISFLLVIIILQFFRSPCRNFTQKENEIISPADGKVVVIEEVMEEEFLKEKCIQVSIFMSPFNVHINRYPISGKIIYFRYHPGNYYVAWHPKSSSENERTTCVLQDDANRKILFRQIAGALARRIVFYGKEGANIKQTTECGFIKFGSRVDLFLPLNTEISVVLGQKVSGGITTIAKLR